VSTAVSDSRPFVQTDEILGYWFEHLDDAQRLDMKSSQCRRWHAKDPQTDAEITRRFARNYEACLLQDPWPAEMSARDRLALILLFDQFPRNMFRGSPKMYEADGVALRLAKDGIAAQRDDEALPLVYRMFLYMPLMHSEKLAHQEQTVELFRHLHALAANKSPLNQSFFQMAFGYAVQHRDIVARFKRFPHRNAILGRTSTPEELEFLRQVEPF
jgi:uncharacterized protein (DUF924 family)